MSMRKFIRDALPSRTKAKNKSRSNVEHSYAHQEIKQPDEIDEKFPAPRLSSTFPPSEPLSVAPLVYRRYNTAPTGSPGYDYGKLPEHESLRTLELLPGKGEDPIVCKLHVTDWNDPMPFEAVSYAWGDPKMLASIMCDGQKLEITPNLVDCLYQLRRPNESRHLWADAACINQRDYEERGHQVDNMRRIYECASRLLIWLGKDDGGYARQVVQSMTDLAQKCCDATQQNVEGLHAIDDLREAVSLQPNMITMPSESWQAIEKLFLCSWFSRLWVFQEVVSVQRAEVHWGEVTIDWDIVGLTATFILSWSHVIEHKYLQPGVYNCYAMRNRNNHTKFSVPSILNWSRTFHCSDPLDRIYAMLGFPSFNRNGFSIGANYKRTPDELFIEVADQCMKIDNNLQILSYTDHTQNSHLNKPSWVPQWDPGSPGWTIGFKRISWRWCATKGKQIAAEINFDSSVLQTKGVLVDIVKDFKQMSNVKWYPYRPTKDHPIMQAWKDSFYNDWNYPSGERAIDVLGSCFVAGIPSNECKCCTRQEIIRKDFAAYMIRCAEESGEATDDEVWVEAYHQGSRGDWRGYEQNGMNFCFGRSLFETKKGWMGLGPNTLEIDDVVVLLYGGDVPHVLRPRPEGGHVLVGEAYVHGVMLGELMPKVDAGEYEEKMWNIY